MTARLKELLAATAVTLVAATGHAQERDSLLPLLSLNETAQKAFGEMLPANPGLDSALIVMRANRVCRGVKFQPDEVADAIAIITGALSPTFRDNPDVSHGKMEREQINSLTENEAAFDNLRRANLNCFELESRVERVREDLERRGRPLSTRLAKVVQQGPASSEISVQEPPVINIIVQEAPRRSLLQMLLPWNW